MRHAFALILLWTLALAAPLSAAPALGLDGLWQPKAGVSMRASSSDAEPEGNADSVPIPAGKTLVLADLDGPGMVTHLWNTTRSEEPFYSRLLVLRIYWDGEKAPSVEAPLGDFFGVGHGMDLTLDSLPVRVTAEGRARNCYWPMPFRKSARITLTNEGREDIASFFYYVDWLKLPKLPKDTPYFHAMYRQEHPAVAGRRYLLANIQGKGHYVGTVLSVRARYDGWYGEGDDFFLIDGEKTPSLRGTGTEDYFCDAWGFREQQGAYYGATQVQMYKGGRNSAYRWHVPDPIVFKKSLRAEIEHTGFIEGDEAFGERDDFYSSVAYWYQAEPHKPWAPIPEGYDRLYYQGVVENVLDMDAPIEQKAERLQQLLEEDAVAIDTVLVDTPIFEENEARVFLRNQARIPVKVAGAVYAKAPLKAGPAKLDITLKPGEERWIDIALNTPSPVPVAALAPVLTEWTFTYSPQYLPGTALTVRRSIIVDTAFSIPKASKAVAVDGDLAEWGALPFNAGYPGQLRVAPDAWEGPDDLSFRFAVTQDDQNVYIAVRTIDDLPLTKAGRPPWYQDGVEIRVDARPDPKRSNWNEWGSEFEEFLFYALLPAEQPEDTILYLKRSLPSGTKAVCLKTPAGHDTEIAIPHAALDRFRGAPWDALRINIAIDDFDSPAGPLVQYWWRPDWRFGQNYPGSGTFLR